MDTRGGFVRESQLNPALFLGTLGGARFEHELERPHLLVRDGDRATRRIGFSAGA